MYWTIFYVVVLQIQFSKYIEYEMIQYISQFTYGIDKTLI